MILLAKHLRVLLFDSNNDKEINEFERLFPNGLDLDKFEIKVFHDLEFWMWINLIKKHKFILDSRNNLIEHINLSGISNKYEYNEYDRLIKWIHPTNGTFEWKYDSYGNVIKEILNGSTFYRCEYIYEKDNFKKLIVNGETALEIIES
jgi:YD repeat-containing protein